jgi:UDP-N-acetylglucosamine--N-acetylmuramyl-(pentapeptide) pyrophosphoryl-undecaprenol N-acetylglucosamine transferase
MFADSAAFLSKRAAIANTGNPVRRSIIERAAERADEANESRDADPVLLVLGGSQGAHGINQFVVENLPQLASNLPGWEVIHQTGDRDERVVREAYESRQIRCTVSRFIDDIAQVYARTTLAIARAGATTLAELAVAGIPAVLIPYPYAASNHQWHNAQAFGRAGAALVVEQRLGVAGPVSAVIPLLRGPELRREMRLSMLRLGRPDAARAIASQILRLARSSQPLQKLA